MKRPETVSMVEGGGLEQAAGKQAKGKRKPALFSEVRGVSFHDQLKAVLLVMLLGAVSNFALLSGSWFLMLLYEEVLPSESGALLLNLLGLLAVVQAGAAAIDWGRDRAMAHLGAILFLERKAQSPTVWVAAHEDSEGKVDPETAFASPAIVSFLDLPWTLIFLAVLAFFHPFLGLLATAGAIAIFAVGMLARSEIVHAISRLQAIDRRIASTASRTNSDRKQGDSTPEAGYEASRQRQLVSMYRDRALARLGVGAGTSRFRAIVRPLRQFLQSATLALGAWLVIEGELNPAAMFASSVLLGRMVAPIEQVAIIWPDLLRGLKTWWVEGKRSQSQTAPCKDERWGKLDLPPTGASQDGIQSAPGEIGSRPAAPTRSTHGIRTCYGTTGRKRGETDASVSRNNGCRILGMQYSWAPEKPA